MSSVHLRRRSTSIVCAVRPLWSVSIITRHLKDIVARGRRSVCTPRIRVLMDIIVNVLVCVGGIMGVLIILRRIQMR